MFNFHCVADSRHDHRAAAAIVDRVLSEEISWLAGNLDNHRRWCGVNASESYLDWHQVHSEAAKRRIRIMGKFTGEAGHIARKALYVLASLDPSPDAVVLMLDTDRHEERVVGMKAAIEESRLKNGWQFPIILGVANRAREGWILTAFLPKTQREKVVLKEVETRLGSDPYSDLLALNARAEDDPRCPKWIVNKLLEHDHDRETECWVETPFKVIEQRERALLSKRGENTGLWNFITEIREILVPSLTGRPSQSREQLSLLSSGLPRHGRWK